MLNNFRNLFIFCVNIDIDELLLLDKNKNLGLISLESFPILILEKLFWFIILFYFILFHFIGFIFCLNVDICKVLLIDKEKGPRV